MKISTYEERRQWRDEQLRTNDPFVTEMPKIELHVHIEGTMTPELRWKLAQKNALNLTVGPRKVPLVSLPQIQEAYKGIRGRIGAASADASNCFTFFEAYYGGFDLLRTEEDYFDLAMGYFQRAAEMNIRYCEPFFDPQGHTRRGIAMEVMMQGFARAQKYADQNLNVKSQWIMCMLRDMSPESALSQYEAALPYKDMIVGIGLDSDEYDRPPVIFEEVFRRARADGLKITSHCDFNQKDTYEHIRQVVESVGGSGADRIDHGLNAADRNELIEGIRAKNIGMTICPGAYIRHTAGEEVFPRIRKLYDAGIKIVIASDDPAYMEDFWISQNLLLARDKCKFTNLEMIQLQKNAVDICWARDTAKQELLDELSRFQELQRTS